MFFIKAYLEQNNVLIVIFNYLAIFKHGCLFALGWHFFIWAEEHSVGLTLPLLSFGGSGIVANLLALGFLMRIDFENRQMIRGYSV